MTKAFYLSLFALIVLFGLFLGPHALGDTPSYVASIDVMNGTSISGDFVPNRLLTTFGALEIINIGARTGGDVFTVWFTLNCLLYLAGSIAFFKLLIRMFQNERVAYLGGLFLAGSYGYLIFGLNYSIDIGGWAFYIFSIYFLYEYSQSKKESDLLLAAAMVGIGGLFKEYAFLGAVAIAAYLIVENRNQIRSLVIKGLKAGAIAIVPTLILYLYIYHKFGYTYLDWFGFNSGYYVYHSRVIEYIKSLGSLINVLGVAFLVGLYALSKEWRGIGENMKSFLSSVFISFLPIFLWPAITQRILTSIVPFVVIVSCFAIKKHLHRWYLFAAILIIYTLATFFMDSYILNKVTLPF